jgi:mycobactin peptide synthetase MbtE
VNARTSVELVLAQAARRKDATAVRQWDERLSYAQLVDSAARLAAELQRHGVRPEHAVGVCLGRRPSMVPGLLGVLLAGAAYVPLDPRGPTGRRDEIIADAGIDVIVVDGQTAALLAGCGRQLIAVPAARPAPPDGDHPDDHPYDHPDRRPVCPVMPDNAAYVLYTSGSTGRPKGVVVTHRALTRFLVEVTELTGADEHCRAIGFSSLGFDVSIIDLLAPLIVGGSIQLAGDSDRDDPARLQRFCETHEVTWGSLPPAVLPLLDPARLPALRLLMTGSEAPGPEQVARWSTPTRRLLNCYGATETTVQVTWFEAAGSWDRPLPIGRPTPNHRVHVVDDRLRPVAAGTPGELLVGGAGVARGYLGDPALTADRFVPDPFGGHPGARLYRTGDLAVWRPDGQLHLLGRLDRQVKIHGQRVEIGEVETVLRGHPRVVHAAVDAVPGPAGPALVGYVTPEHAPDAAELREYCERLLPAAMVPARFVRLATLPLTPSDKIDFRRLRKLVDAPEPNTGTPPETATELAVSTAWGRVLGHTRPGREDDFFSCGGHSVAAMRLVAALRADLDRDVAVEDVLLGRTLAGIAARVAAAAPLDGVDLVRGNRPDLSPAQRRLWFLDRYAPQATAYNIAVAHRLHGALDVEALRAALSAATARHEVLRWLVRDAGGVPFVEVDPARPAELPVEEVHAPDPEHALRQLLEAEATHRFDLASGPLWRARLLRLGPVEHVLTLTFHHAVFDGWSERPYLEDLAAAYTAAVHCRPVRLPDPPAQFADYVAWRAERDDRHGETDLAWWIRHLADPPAPLELPTDHPRPPVQTYRGALTGAELEPATTSTLRRLAAELGTTPPTVLLAGFGELLRRITGRHDLVIGTPAADRRHHAFEDLVGFFVEVVPLRLRMDAADSFADRVRACAEEFLAVLAHPGATLERIVDALGLLRDPSRPPLVQLLFNVHNFPEPRLSLPGLQAERIQPGLAGSPFDLTIYIVERDGGYAVECVYNPDLYAPPRIEGLLAAYTTLLERACSAPERPAAEPALPGLSRLSAGHTAEHTVAARMGSAVTRAPAGPTAKPVTRTERLVAATWCEVLRRSSVGAGDNFFDIGGHSLAIAQVQARLTELLDRDVRVVDLFHYPTVRALAAYLDGASGTPQLVRAVQRGAARRNRARAARETRARHRSAGRPSGTAEQEIDT